MCLDKEHCLAREPHLQAQNQEEKLVRPFESLLILPDVKAAYETESSFSVSSQSLLLKRYRSACERGVQRFWDF